MKVIDMKTNTVGRMRHACRIAVRTARTAPPPETATSEDIG